MKLDFQSGESLAGAVVSGLPHPGTGVRSNRYIRPRGVQTILLVQDQGLIRDHMVTCLENLGYNVLSSADPQTALAKVREFRGRIDLLLTDFSMPGISGPELSRMAAEQRPGIKVLYMSSYPEELVWQSEFRKQRPAWLAKPFTQQLLADGVQKALGFENRVVLILHEDEEVRAFLAGALRSNNYEIFEAAGLDDSREILNENRVHLLIGDLARFENKGEESIRNFRRLYPGTRIMVLTGNLPAVSKHPPFVRRHSRRPMEKDDLKARWLRGANATLPKPVSPELLLQTVAEIFKN